MSSPIQFAVASDEGRSNNANGSRLINFFAETLPPTSKNVAVLYGTPGQKSFVTLPTAPVKAMIEMNGLLYAITATKLYSVTSAGVITLIDSVTMAGSVSIASNGVHIAFVDGIKGYYYSIAGGLHEFTGAGWYASTTVTCQDGYFIFNRTGTGQFFFTGILATTLDALDYATAEASPDNTLAIISDQSSLWIFGESSIEIWYNDGVTPWARMHGAYIERGIGAPYSIVKMDTSLFFIGNNGVVYRTSGYSLNRVSNHAIEYEFLRGNISNAYAYSYTQEGHIFYVLTIPDINRTCVYDTATSLWHERSHSVEGRHDARCYVKCYDKHLIGNYSTGAITSLDMTAYDDNGVVIVREAVAPVVNKNRSRLTMYEFELDVMFEVQTESTTGITGSPKVTLYWSDNDCRTWSTGRDRLISPVTGVLKTVRWQALGQFVQRHIKIKTSDVGPITIAGAYTIISNDN